MPVVISNNATSLLAAAIDAAATTLSVENGDAGKFPNPSNSDWFPLTIVDNAGNMEIVKATAREGAIITVERAQEGTTAKAFGAGARVDHRLTAGAIRSLSYLPLNGGRLAGGVTVQIADTNGALNLVSGDDTHTGYIEGKLPDGTRGWYLGWAEKDKRVIMAAENGLKGFEVIGDLRASMGFESYGNGSQRGIFRNTGAGDSWINFNAKDAGDYYAEFGLRANGNAYAWVNGKEYRFQNNGQFWSPGDVVAAGNVYGASGNSTLHGDGNVQGTIWGSWGFSNLAFQAVENRIEKRGAEYADDRKNGCVTDTRFAGWVEHTMAKNEGWHAPSGYVFTYSYRNSGDQYNFGARQPQVFIPYVGWRALGAW